MNANAPATPEGEVWMADHSHIEKRADAAIIRASNDAIQGRKPYRAGTRPEVYELRISCALHRIIGD